MYMYQTGGAIAVPLPRPELPAAFRRQVAWLLVAAFVALIAGTSASLDDVVGAGAGRDGDGLFHLSDAGQGARASVFSMGARLLEPRGPSGKATRTEREQREVTEFISERYRVAHDQTRKFVNHAYQTAREARLDPLLVLAIMSIESSFNPKAQSSAGAQGLMQVLTRVHLDKFAPFGGAAAAFDPRANIQVGVQILKDYLQRFGTVEGALKGYVGAALLPDDGGYGRKVLAERERIAQAAGRPAR